MTREDVELLEELALGEVPLFLFGRNHRETIRYFEANGFLTIQGHLRLVVLTEQGIEAAIDNIDPKQAYAPQKTSFRAEAQRSARRVKGRISRALARLRLS